VGQIQRWQQRHQHTGALVRSDPIVQRRRDLLVARRPALAVGYLAASLTSA